MTLQIISLLFGSGVLVALAKLIATQIKNANKKTEALERGVQALLRNRLYISFDEHYKKKSASISARENFLNMYNSYHELGANGCMDEIKEKFLAIPIEDRKE